MNPIDLRKRLESLLGIDDATDMVVTADMANVMHGLLEQIDPADHPDVCVGLDGELEATWRTHGMMVRLQVAPEQSAEGGENG